MDTGTKTCEMCREQCSGEDVIEVGYRSNLWRFCGIGCLIGFHLKQTINRHTSQLRDVDKKLNELDYLVTQVRGQIG